MVIDRNGLAYSWGARGGPCLGHGDCLTLTGSFQYLQYFFIKLYCVVLLRLWFIVFVVLCCVVLWCVVLSNIVLTCILVICLFVCLFIYLFFYLFFYLFPYFFFNLLIIYIYSLLGAWRDRIDSTFAAATISSKIMIPCKIEKYYY